MFTHFFAGCLVTVAAVPDIVTPGTRVIDVEVRMEARPLIDHCCVQRVVAKGETLSKIAISHRYKSSPNPTSVEEILALNPGLAPGKLSVGQRLWMPPRIPGPDTEEKMFVFVSSLWGGATPTRAYAPSDKIATSRRGTYSITLVPECAIAEWTKALEKGTPFEDYRKLEEQGKMKVLQQEGSQIMVWDESPVYSCVDTIKIKRSDKGQYSTELSSVAYDKAGKVVPQLRRIVKRDASKQGLPLILLPMMGAGWLLARRRRRQSQAECA